MPITTLKSVGQKRADLFAKLGLHTLGDLVECYPRDYRDRRSVTPIAEAPIGALVNLQAWSWSTELNRTRSGMTLLKCYLKDDSGILPLILV